MKRTFTFTISIEFLSDSFNERNAQNVNLDNICRGFYFLHLTFILSTVSLLFFTFAGNVKTPICMSDFWLYFNLGLEHVLDWNAYDHVLFLIVLCAGYTFASWKRMLILVTLFTVGHTISLLLANYAIVKVSSAVIEFLIPITILVTALYNVMTAGKTKRNETPWVLFMTTLFFGLIHGFGFAGYFKMISEDQDIIHLLEFALGIEAAQIIVAFLVLVLAFIVQTIFRFNKKDWMLVISSIVIGLVIPMLQENWIF